MNKTADYFFPGHSRKKDASPYYEHGQGEVSYH